MMRMMPFRKPSFRMAESRAPQGATTSGEGHRPPPPGEGYPPHGAKRPSPPPDQQ